MNIDKTTAKKIGYNYQSEKQYENSFLNSNRPVVIKFGGNALTGKTLDDFAKSISKLVKNHPKVIIVHGGGPQINDLLHKLNIETRFIDGLRYTCDKTMSVAEMVLSGQVSKMLTSALYKYGVNAIGLNGKDAGLMTSCKMTHINGQPIDLGMVGDMPKVKEKVLNDLLAINYVPVIAPIAINSEYIDENNTDNFSDNVDNTLNINADYVASAVANAVNAHTLFLMSNIAGVLDKNENLISEIKKSEIDLLIKNGTIYGGMIPKIQSASLALDKVDVIKMIDGRDINAIDLAFTGRNVGTMILK